MGEAADDLREAYEENELQVALHTYNRCDPWACPICIDHMIMELEDN